MKARDVELPNYTATQELWNSITHGSYAAHPGVLVLLFGIALRSGVLKKRGNKEHLRTISVD